MPAPTLATDRIRLRVDADQKTAAKDALRGATPILWRSSDVVLEVGLFFGGAVVDVATLAALTLEIKAPGANNTAPAIDAAPLASKTVTAFDATLDAATWLDLSKQHASVAFTGTEMSFDLGGLRYQWLVISLLTTAGKVLTVAAGLVDIREAGYDSAGTAPVLTSSAYTKAEARALFGSYLPSTALTGGAAGALDALPTLPATEGALLLGSLRPAIVGGVLSWWQLTAGTAAENSVGGIVRPDDYATTTNEKNWIQRA